MTTTTPTEAPLTHDEAIDAICGCAATVTVLSYQEAIEAYLDLRGINLDAIQATEARAQALVDALEDSKGAVQAFLDMVNVMQRVQALPIPAFLETAQHNCPIILQNLDQALATWRRT